MSLWLGIVLEDCYCYFKARLDVQDKSTEWLFRTPHYTEMETGSESESSQVSLRRKEKNGDGV